MKRVAIILSIVVITFSSMLISKVNSEASLTRGKTEKIKKIFERNKFSSINISNSSVDSLASQIVVNHNGIAYVVWERVNSPHAVYFNTNEEGSWGKPVEVSKGTNVSASEPWPDLAIDSNGIVHVVFTAKNSMGYYETWYNSYRPNQSAGSSWSTNENISQTMCGSAHPTIACDPRNFSQYVVWMDQEYKPESFSLFFRYKTSSSTNWSTKTVLPISPSAYTPELTVDGLGRLHLIYLKRAGGNSVIYYTRNGNPTNSNSWTSPVAVSNKTNLNFPHICIDSDNDGDVYVAWEQNVEGNNEIYFRRQINGYWQSIENVSKTGASAAYPDLIVQRSNKKGLLVWQQKKDNKWQIFLKTLQNGKWTGIVALTDNPYNSIMPNVAVDGSGEIQVVYAQKYSSNYDIMYTSTREVGQAILPPVNINLSTKVDMSSGKKRNIISWKKNPNNDDSRVKEYKIYRKELDQGRSQYKCVAAVSKSTFSYEDSNIPANKKFSYVVTAVDIDGQESDYSDEVNEPLVFPPVEIAVSSSLDSQKDSKINLITWKENPENRYGPVQNYKIYRRKSENEENFKHIKTVPGQTFSYEDKNLPTTYKFEYYLTAVDSTGIECEPSIIACEDPIFPPVEITVVTVVNESMFFKEKINVVSWKRNPLNNPVNVSEFRVYKKDLNEENSEYAFVKSLDGTTLRYFDRNLILSHKYSYVLTAVTDDGYESKQSSPVIEE